MKLSSVILLVLNSLFLFSCNNRISTPKNEWNGEKVIVAYVTSWSQGIPDPNLITHLNYAFGHVKDSFDGIRIDNPERFRRLIALKKEKPDLKVMLSIGGWGSGNFSEMASSDSLRNAFARDCNRIIQDYEIDGIDIDWEYPTINWAGISSSEEDTRNFTKLMKDIRENIGKDKLLTLASSSNAKYIDYKEILPYVDFVNLMTYDMSDGTKHHSALYSSSITPEITSSISVKAHQDNGVTNDKIVLGIPFYGRGVKNGETYYCDYKDIKIREGESKRWDNKAKAPFIADSLGNFIFGFDDPRSVSIKCEYIIENDLKGAMYWDYNGDDSLKTLSKTIFSSLSE